VKIRPVFSRIVARILLINTLIVFLPIGSFLFLDTYEQQLLQTLERSLVQQGRLLAATLGTYGRLTEQRAQEILTALEGRTESRLRVLDASGTLLADSSTVRREARAAAGDDAVAQESVAPRDEEGESADPRRTFLYRLASFPVRLSRTIFGSPELPLPSADFYNTADYASGKEVQTALSGSYGAATRVSAGGQISVTLYSALPIRRGDAIVGAVLVSQSTFRILQNLYQLRIDIFEIFLITLLAAVIISGFLAFTIARPIAQLQRRAQEAVDERGRLRGPLPPESRADEIGGLSRALTTLTARIDRYTKNLENFAADSSHELKNPLASIRAHAELAEDARDLVTRKRFLGRIQTDVARALTILNGMRELSHIDADREPHQSCGIGPVVEEAVAAAREAAAHEHQVTVTLDNQLGSHDPNIPLSKQRLLQVIDNLLSNAITFTPSGGTVTVTLALREAPRREHQISLVIRDSGDGFAEEELSRVFDRFYSSRNETGNLGLGLSIVRAIVLQAGGEVSARNHALGGAEVAVLLPAHL
jgi:two-component system, OmpR family, sensor histidine kinase ChvG